jgi:hypothetical protein
MRIIAHWEGRAPVFTVGGTVTILFAATMAGLAGGIVHGLLAKFVDSVAIRMIVFLALCMVFTWRAVNELLPRPRLMFIVLTLVWATALELVSRRRRIPTPEQI